MKPPSIGNQRIPSAAAAFCLAGAVVACASACSQSYKQQAETKVNDALITAKVRAKLAGVDPALLSLVSVHTENGKVTLAGQVANQAERTEAEKASRSVDGVRDVADDIRINPNAPTGQDIAGDLELQAKVKTALAGQTGINAFHIDVAVHKGVVTLEGTVPTPALHQVALDTARFVRGVRSVVDRIRVVGP